MIGALVSWESTFREIGVFRIVYWNFLDGDRFVVAKHMSNVMQMSKSGSSSSSTQKTYVMGWSDDAPPQVVALDTAWARQELDDGEVSGTSSEDEPLFPSCLGRGPRITVGFRPSLRDVRGSRGRCSPGWWPLADGRFPAAPLWLALSCYLWVAASNLTTDGLPRDLALGSVIDSPFAPRVVAFLRRHLEGRRARGGHLRRHEEKDGIAVTLNCALFAALHSLAGEPEGVTMGSYAAGIRIGVGCRLPGARWILERKVKLRGIFKPEDERLTAGR